MLVCSYLYAQITFFSSPDWSHLVQPTDNKLHVAGNVSWLSRAPGQPSENNYGGIKHLFKKWVCVFHQNKQTNKKSNNLISAEGPSGRPAPIPSCLQAGSLLVLAPCSNALDNVQKYETQYYRIKRAEQQPINLTIESFMFWFMVFTQPSVGQRKFISSNWFQLSSILSTDEQKTTPPLKQMTFNLTGFRYRNPNRHEQKSRRDLGLAFDPSCVTSAYPIPILFYKGCKHVD